MIKLKEDTSLDLVQDDEFPGFLYVRISLLKMAPPERVPICQDAIKMRDYQLRVYLYVARNLPPADETGTSDPFIIIRCAGQTNNSNIKSKTLSPGWFETIKLNVSLPDLSQEQIVPSGMFMMLYDADVSVKEKAQQEQKEEEKEKDKGKDKGLDIAKALVQKVEESKPLLQAREEDVDEENLQLAVKDKNRRQLMGRIWIQFQPESYKLRVPTLEQPVSVFFRKPKWYASRLRQRVWQHMSQRVPQRACSPTPRATPPPLRYNVIYDPTNEKSGEVLLSYSLLEQSVISHMPEEKRIYPRSRKEHLNIFCIGLRQVNVGVIEKYEPKKGYVTFDISGDEYDAIKSETVRIKNKGICVNKLIKLDIDLPNNKNFCPTMDICAWVMEDGILDKWLLGYGSINLYEPMKRKYMTKQEQLENPETESECESVRIFILYSASLSISLA